MPAGRSIQSPRPCSARCFAGLAQNERSLFAFLSAGEPLSFRDFLRTHGPDRLYTVDRLYDYATGILFRAQFWSGFYETTWAATDRYRGSSHGDASTSVDESSHQALRRMR